MTTLFVTDPLDGLLADIDATIGLMVAAQDLGTPVWVCGPEDLAVADGRLVARSRRIVLRPECPLVTTAGGSTRRGTTRSSGPRSTWRPGRSRAAADRPTGRHPLSPHDIPPGPGRGCGVRVVNHPAGVRALHEKVLALRFPRAVPAQTSSPATREVEARSSRGSGSAVVKPVDGFAGNDVWLLGPTPAAAPSPSPPPAVAGST